MDASHRYLLRFFGVAALLHVAVGSFVIAMVRVGATSPETHAVAVEVSLIEPERSGTTLPAPVAAGSAPEVGAYTRATSRPAPAPIDAPRSEAAPAMDDSEPLGPAEAIAPRLHDDAGRGDSDLGTALMTDAAFLDGTAEGSSTQGDAVRAWLERHKRYPRAAAQRGIEGEATLQLDLDAAGGVRSTAIVRSSGHGVLDDEVARMVARATPFPKETRPVAGIASYRIVVEFYLEDK